MKFRRTYGILSALFFIFLGLSIASPLLKLPPAIVGSVGFDIGTFLFRNLGILAIAIPIAGLIVSLGILFKKTFRSIVLSLHVLLFFFIAELILSVWLKNSFWGGDLSTFIREFLHEKIGTVGSSLLIIGLILALFAALDVKLPFPKRKKKTTYQETKPTKSPLNSTKPELKEEDVTIEEIKEEKAEPPKEEEDVIDLTPKDEEGNLRIVEGGGELAQVLTPDLEETEEEPIYRRKGNKNYKLPSPDLLGFVKREKKKVNPKELETKAALLEEKLKDFGVTGKVVSVHYGPVVSMFEYKPAPGIKVSKILNLQDDIAVVMKAGSVRIVAPIPGKDTIGIELPNDERETVYFTEILNSDVFQESPSPLTLILGKDIFGKPFVADLRKMPHLLVAGATGSGKSVGLNSMICSILFKATPDEVKFILVDPKMLEFSVYNGIPHLITPVITDPKKASTALSWAVSEMEKRYQMLSQAGVRSIERYNIKIEDKLPYIVIVIDELADLMMVAGKDVEMQIARLAQKARAAGIHLIVATQRPSVDVITGLIKANFPSRISFKVSSKVDSRTILDTVGAEKLLGNGDMLFMPPGKSDLIRLHGAYIGDREIEAVAEFWKKQAEPEYRDDIFEKPKINGTGEDKNYLREEYDELYDEAVEFVTSLGYASASLLQRQFKIGYNRAARLIEMMEKDGIVGPAQGSKPREVLIRKSPKINLPEET